MLILLYLYGIINTYVSIKYEIDELSSKTVSHGMAEEYAYQLIFTLLWMMCYVALIIVYLMRTRKS